MKRVLPATLLLSCAALLIAGCARDELSGPPELRLGRDECGECGMLINEERSSAAILIQREGGAIQRREYVMFDDIGCMIDYEYHRGDEFNLIDSFARDYGTSQWVRADDAHFLFADPEKLRTPMGSGIAAFTTPARAEARQAETGGDIMDYAELHKARREWMWERYGRPEGR